MAQDRNLPEGTDKVIAGAASSGETVTAPGRSAGTGTGKDSTTSLEGKATRARATSPRTTTGDDDTLVGKVKSSAGNLSGQAADKARDWVGQGLVSSSDALTSVSRMIADTAEGIDERLGREYGDYARRAAQSIDSTATSLRTKDPEQLIDDTRTFVRKSPGVALAGAAILGFAVARLVKSGLDSAGLDRDGGEGGRKGGREDRSN